MAENSGISWTDNTFNPWIGCSKVSPACANCYAERDMDHRFGRVKWGPNGQRSVTSNANWGKPIKWNREAEKHGKRLRVFCASLADVFEDWNGPMLNTKGAEIRKDFNGNWLSDGCAGILRNDFPVTMQDIRQRLFDLIDATPNLDWLLLTKRPENIVKMWPSVFGEAYLANQDKPQHPRQYRNNVWLGTSVENQAYAEKRIPELLKCRGLARVLFLSCEPLVGPLNLRVINAGSLHSIDCLAGEQSSVGIGGSPGKAYPSSAVDWVITGGESGPNARACDPNWFRDLRDQCKQTSVPFHFKQWGELNENLDRVGVVTAGRMLDGEVHDSFPFEVAQ